MKPEPKLADPTCRATLIREQIELDPSRPGASGARLVGFAVPVWALVGYLKAGDWSVDDAATAFEVPRDAVLAAIAYYELHPAVIEAKLEANDLAAI